MDDNTTHGTMYVATDGITALKTTATLTACNRNLNVPNSTAWRTALAQVLGGTQDNGSLSLETATS